MYQTKYLGISENLKLNFKSSFFKIIFVLLPFLHANRNHYLKPGINTKIPQNQSHIKSRHCCSSSLRGLIPFRYPPAMVLDTCYLRLYSVILPGRCSCQRELGIITDLGAGREGRKTQVLEETELYGSTQTFQELTVKH